MAVYEKYYHCKREPFSLSPDPGFLYYSAVHREALAQLQYLIQERKGFAVLTGEVGTGKTLLLRTLMESLDSKTETAYLFNPPHTREALFQAIADELNVDIKGHADPRVLLNRRFLESHMKGGTVVLIFDEAQSIQPPMLEEIRLMANLETSSAKLLQVIFAGQPEFESTLESPELRALRQRLVFRFSLTALGAVDTNRYIVARLGAAGASSSLFTIEARNSVHEYSRGIPRLINAICDNAMLAGYAVDAPLIGNELIKEVASDLRLVGAIRSVDPLPAVSDSNQRSMWVRHRRLAVAVACLFLILVIAAAAGIAGLASIHTSPLTHLQGWFSSAANQRNPYGMNLVGSSEFPCKLTNYGLRAE
jgi:general secretion pathway protein A